MKSPEIISEFDTLEPVGGKDSNGYSLDPEKSVPSDFLINPDKLESKNVSMEKPLDEVDILSLKQKDFLMLNVRDSESFDDNGEVTLGRRWQVTFTVEDTSSIQNIDGQDVSCVRVSVFNSTHVPEKGLKNAFPTEREYLLMGSEDLVDGLLSVGHEAQLYDLETGETVYTPAIQSILVREQDGDPEEPSAGILVRQ